MKKKLILFILAFLPVITGNKAFAQAGNKSTWSGDLNINPKTFSAFKDGYSATGYRYTAFDMITAGDNATDFRVVVGRAVHNSTSTNAQIFMDSYTSAGVAEPHTLEEQSYDYSVARGYTSLALATDSRDKNTGAAPYSLALVAGKAHSYDSVIVWTDNDGGANLNRTAAHGTLNYIRNVSAAIGSASTSTSAWGRLGFVWDEYTGTSTPWGTVYIMYLYPDDGSTVPGGGPFNINPTTGDARKPSIALSQNTTAYDVKTYVVFEGDGGGQGANMYARVDTVMIHAQPAFLSSPPVGTGSGDQLGGHVMYNAATDSFMVTYYDDATAALVYKRAEETSIITLSPVLVKANYRDAGTAAPGAMPRVDAASGGAHAYFVWNDNNDTYFDGESYISTGIQSVASTLHDLVIYPNPTTDMIVLEFASDTRENATFTITDLSGRILKTENITINEGSNRLQADLGWLAQGNYLISIKGPKSNTASMVVKQ
jgi:hypothetical protein